MKSIEMKSSRFLFIVALVSGTGFSFFSTAMTSPMPPPSEGILVNTSSSNPNTEANLYVTAHCPSTIGIKVTKNTMNVLNESGEQETDPNEYTATFKLSGSAENVKITLSAEGDSVSNSGGFRITHETEKDRHIPILISYVGPGNKGNIEDVTNNAGITINRESADAEYKVTAKVNGRPPSQIPGSAGDYGGTIKLQVAPAN